MLTVFIKGIQVDILPAIVYDARTGLQIRTEYIYYVRNSVAYDDQFDTFSDVEPNDPCISNPCKNNGLCSKAFSNSFACLCPSMFEGKLLCLRFRSKIVKKTEKL